MPFDTTAITNIPPKRLAIIVAGGIGAGLLWRKLSNRGQSATTIDTANGGVDLSKLALQQNSTGNLGAGGLGDAQTQPIPNPNDATRDLGNGSSFPLPVTKFVQTGQDGIDYYVSPDGEVLGPVNPIITLPVQPGGSPSTPTPTSWVPDWLNGWRFVKGASASIYEITPTGLRHVPSWDAFVGSGGSIGEGATTGGNTLVTSDQALAGLPIIG